MKTTFGSDPELLLVKDGKPKSAIGVIQGSPDNRIKVKGHEFYYDNVLAECAIKPSSSKKETLDNFRECLKIYADMVKPYKLAPVACMEFPDQELDSEEARRAGCAPDMCAYEMKQKEPPKDLIQNGNLRSCGGHVHLGSELLASDGPEPILAIYMLDLFVGVPSLHLDFDSTSLRRRIIYGQSGRYRTKDYGLEYRSLGNFWLSSPKMTGLIYDLCMFVHEFVEKGQGWDLWEFDLDVFFSSDNIADSWKCTGYDAENLRKGINSGDKDMTMPHFELAKRLMPTGLKNEMQKMIARDGDGDFYENWGIK
jgi:hypothetical protein